jgi:hypothetical protein
MVLPPSRLLFFGNIFLSRFLCIMRGFPKTSVFGKTSSACQAALMLVGKPGLGPVFPRDWDKTNRVLEQAQMI